jgi:hypothetical protein
MAKPYSGSLKAPLSLRGLIIQVLRDLDEFLPLEGKEQRQSAVLHLSTQDLVEVLRNELSEAETSANTQFTQLAALRQVVALFDKNKDTPGTSGPARKAAALKKFFASEKKCRITNRRLSFFAKHPSRLSNDMSEVVALARDIITGILGPLGRLEIQKIIEGSGFGPGFTFLSNMEEHRNLYYKALGPHCVTRDAVPYMKLWLNHWTNWKTSLISEKVEFSIVNGNRVTTVPKNSVTDRTIAIEPSFNVFMQKGVDNYLKRRLHRYGVTLLEQDRNHDIARLASMRPLFAATLDLSAASDCVSTGIIQYLLPPDWCIFLDDLRSKSYTLDKGESWTVYDKFSSMGNAFTFPIESLIFYAVSRACTILVGGNLRDIRVYGDDIIIAPQAYCLLVESLRFLGFTPNLDKSFAYGSFRETCGSDFLSGVDLRPVYVKSLPRTDIEVYNLFNRFLWNRVGFKLQRTCAYLYRSVVRPLIGPPYLPPKEKYSQWYAGKSVVFDNYFHAPPDTGERFRQYDSNWQSQVYVYKRLRLIPKKLDTQNWNLQFRYLAFLLGIPGDHVDSNSRFRRVLVREQSSFWPEPPWRPYLYDS